jgi:WD40 repeat protein
MQRAEVPSEILGILNSALLDKRNRGLKGAEKVLVDGIWLGLKYEEIAEQSDHKVQYLKNTVGPALFRDLREAIDPKIGKANFRVLLEQRLKDDRATVGAEVVSQEVKLDVPIDRLEMQGVPASDDEIYGREREVARLKEYMKPGGAALVCVYSLGGFGKTTLVGKVVREVDARFEQVMWISLQEQQSYQRVLELMLQRFEEQGGDRAALRGATALEQCLQMMQVATCLVVLEDFHRVLPSWSLLPPEGEGQENWLAYQQLLRRLNQRSHRSCLVVVSRVQPRFFSEEMGSSRVRSIELEGLDEGAIEQFLVDRQVVETVESDVLKRFRQQSMGHPLTLKLSAARIRNLFDGDIQAFLDTGSLAYGGLKSILEEEFKGLERLEKEVLYWLLINRDPVESRTPIRFEMLHEDVLMPPSVDSVELLGNCLDVLVRRSLIDAENGAFRLHELVGEYVKECLIEDVVAELGGDREELYFLNHCALVKAKSNDSIRMRQVREVIMPIVTRLQTGALKRYEEPKTFFLELLERSRTSGSLVKNYFVSNIIQFCRTLKINPANFDFSELSIRQASFRNIELHNVNFSRASAVQSIFNDIFGGVICVRCSPDGLLLGSADTDGNISIWNYRSRELKCKIKAHTSWIFHIRFSPDSKYLVSASEDGSCCIWDIETSVCVKKLCSTHRFLALDLSPDGKVIAAAGENSKIFLWEFETGKLIHTLQGHGPGIIWSCTFSYDGKTIVSTSTDKTIRIWKLCDFSNKILIRESSSQCRSLTYSLDGRFLARVRDRNIICIWDTELECEIAELRGHSQEVWTVMFGRDRNELISAGTDRQIFVWDIDKREKIRVFQGHDATVYSVAYHPKEGEIVSGSADQSICFWDYFESDLERQKLNQLQGFSSCVRSIIFLSKPDRHILISGGSDQKVYQWDIPNGISVSSLNSTVIEPKVFERTHSGFIWSVAGCARHNIIASAGDDSVINLWELNSGIKKFSLSGHLWNIFSVAFDSTCRRIVSGSLDETIRIWNLSSGRPDIIVGAHADGVRHVRFSPDDTMVVSCGNDATIKIWDANHHKCLKIYTGHQSFVQFFDFSPDGKLLISCSDDQTIRLWNLDDFADHDSELKIFRDGHTAWIRGVCFSPDGQFFASCGEDGLVCLWSIDDGNIVWRSELEDQGGVKCVAFTQDGQWLASGSDDGAVRLWRFDQILNRASPEPVILRTIQPYRGLNISNVRGINDEQCQILRKLGAVEGLSTSYL